MNEVRYLDINTGCVWIENKEGELVKAQLFVNKSGSLGCRKISDEDLFATDQDGPRSDPFDISGLDQVG